MQTFRVTLLLTLILGALLAACNSSTDPTTQATPAPVTVQLTTKPETPQAGEVEMIFTVVDLAGQPLTGADFDVIADHTDMGGMTLHGKATEQADGQYSIKANFSMSGKWKVSVQIQKEGLDYRKDIDFQVK